MKIIITGATGTVGSFLIPKLKSKSHELVVVGRDKIEVGKRFAGCEATDYQSLKDAVRDGDLLIHLATINNNVECSLEERISVDFDFAKKTIDQALKGGVKQCILISSIHGVTNLSQTDYAKSKRLAIRKFLEIGNPMLTIVSVGYVYGESWTNKFELLNRMPRNLADACFSLFSAFKPTTHIQLICDLLERLEFQVNSERHIILCDTKLKNPCYQLFKRSIDFFVPLFALFVFLMPMILSWLFIKWETKGPGIFCQKRVGADQKPFVMYKLRTMKTSTQSLGSHEVPASSVTAVGRVLRKLKLDEMPQMLNVLKKDMSLIGPRPCLEVQTEVIRERDNRAVFDIPPGVTGLAQIEGIDMSKPSDLAIVDATYIKIRSISVDLKILLFTFFGAGFDDRVRQDKKF